MLAAKQPNCTMLAAEQPNSAMLAAKQCMLAAKQQTPYIWLPHLCCQWYSINPGYNLRIISIAIDQTP